jgi:predicted ATP-grasp superfamily ATP-dependent carboligase/protein-tyrosine-phosphatase
MNVDDCQMTCLGKALVLGNDTRSFLTVVRSLGRKGVEVHVAWCDRDLPSFHSRYVACRHGIPRYRPDDDTWKQRLRGVLRKEQFDLVIPCDDPSIIPLQYNRTCFENLSRIYLLPDDVFKTTIDKEKTRRLAVQLGIPVAREIRIDSERSNEEILRGFSTPAVVKPISSFSHQDTVNRRYVEKARTADELRRIVAHACQGGPVLVQEHFSGYGAGVEILAQDGEILAAFQHERVHEPLWGGGSSYRKSVKLDAELFGAARRIIEALRYTGVAMIEFMVNPRNGAWIMVEVNARFWGSLPLSVAAGVDFPWYLFNLMVNNKRPKIKSYKENLFCRNLTLDLEWFRANLLADKNDVMLHTVPLKKLTAEAFNLVSGRERSDTFVADDPLPGLVDLFFWTQHKVSSVKRKLDYQIQCLDAVKARQREMALKRILRGKNIHFACTGNICRSPFAHYLARQRLSSEFNLSSSGVSTQTGRSCPALALAVAGRMGVDMHSHRSIRFRGESLNPDVTVFAFDNFGYETLIRDFGLNKTRVFHLGLFANSSGIEIEDPYGSDDAGFDKSFRRIQEAVLNIERLCNAQAG